MKICHLLWGLKYGGIETMVINIANAQAAEGHDVHLMIVNDMIDPPLLDRIAPGVTFHNAGRRVGSKNPLPLLRLNLMFLRMRPDIVHFHHVRLHRYVLPALRPHWCTTHHNDCLPDAVPYMKENPNLFAISNLVQREIMRHTGMATRVVTNGIDTGRFKVRPSGTPADNPFRIVQVGRLYSVQKGQDILIEAIAILRRKGMEVAADLIGEGNSRRELEALIKARGLENDVRLLGARTPEYVENHLCEYDLLVQPSRFEGFGLTIAEGMAAGVPVLVSDIDVQLEVTDSGKCGYTFATESPSALADEIVSIIRNPDPAMAGRALARVREYYDVSATAQGYLREYRKLLSGD